MIESLSLCGSWTLEEALGRENIAAHVPGSVLHDLLAAGLIPDPFVGENEVAARALFDRGYSYARSFRLDAAFLARERVELCCQGLDTLATVYINGQEAGKSDNMHRTWRFDVKKLLRTGENHIRVCFDSPNAFLEQAVAQDPEINYRAAGNMRGSYALRKAHSMFGWDWGPQLPDAGVWRPLALESWNGARLMAVEVRQAHEDEGVRLGITPRTGEGASALPCLAELFAPDGSRCASLELVTGTECWLDVPAPQLWYPQGLGAQPLYTLRVTLTDACQSPLDRWQRRIGLRTLTVQREKDAWGESFAFQCNGIPFFAMGADYIPEDSLLPRVKKERTRQLLQDCVAAHFNCIRVWGGGYYPDDFFFDLCDELGLVVWLDLMFACNIYRLTPAFTENIRREAEDNLLRLRDHACLGLICGNNEMEGGWCFWEDVTCHSDSLRQDYLTQFEDVLAKAVKETAPEIFYWPSSPSSGGGFDHPEDENRGDAHYWDVWHGSKPFTAYREFHFRFCSEFGFQSFPCMKTIASYAQGREQNIFSRVMESHQKNSGANEKILTYLGQTLRLPTSLDKMVYASQYLQAEAIRYGVEHWRRNRGRCMGALYWQLNDCWPVASWSSIDYFGRWKQLHYAARRFFAPVLASLVIEGTGARIHVTNDTRQPFAGKMTLRLVDEKGTVLGEDVREVACPPLSALEVGQADFAPLFPQNVLHPQDHRALCYTLTDTEGKEVSAGCELFTPPKHFALQPPCLRWEAEETGDAFRLTLSCDALALGVWLEVNPGDGHFSDNGFALLPGEKKTVLLPKGELTQAQLEKQLTLRSLYDLG